MDGAATAEGPPLRVGRLLTIRVRPSAAPQPQNMRNRTHEETLALTHSTTSLCSTHVHLAHVQPPRCDSAASLKHARHAHAQ